MQRQSGGSRGIRDFRYDEAERTLEIEYASTGTYRYLDVPPSVYDWLLKADSKGRFVNRLVKDKYRYERVGEPRDEPDDLGPLLRRSLDSPNEEPE